MVLYAVSRGFRGYLVSSLSYTIDFRRALFIGNTISYSTSTAGVVIYKLCFKIIGLLCVGRGILKENVHSFLDFNHSYRTADEWYLILMTSPHPLSMVKPGNLFMMKRDEW